MTFDPADDHVAKELSPLSVLTEKKLPLGMTSDDVLRVFLEHVGGQCSPLTHLPEYGFDLETVRRFFSAYAGHRLDIPPHRILVRLWDDLHLWLAVESYTTPTTTRVVAIERVMERYGVPRKRVLRALARYAPDPVEPPSSDPA